MATCGPGKRGRWNGEISPGAIASAGPRWRFRNRARGGRGNSGPTKSGRKRKVALSKRLLYALSARYKDAFEPGPKTVVLGELSYWGFVDGPWRRITKKADLAGVTLKNLRETFASQLLTVGVPIQWIAAQLGHANISTTQKHYAKYLDDRACENPMQLDDDEVFSDFLARLPPQLPTKLPTHISENR